MNLNACDGVEITEIDGLVTIAVQYAGHFGAIRFPSVAITPLAMSLLFDLKPSPRRGE